MDTITGTTRPIDPSIAALFAYPPVKKMLDEMQASWAKLVNRTMDISATMFTQMMLYGYAHEENREYVLERKRIISDMVPGYEMHVGVFKLFVDNVFVDYVGAYNVFELRNGQRFRDDQVVLLDVLMVTAEDLAGIEHDVDDARFLLVRPLSMLSAPFAFV